MSRFKTYFRYFIVALVFFAGCSSNIRFHREFQAKRADMHSIAVLSPDIEFFERSATINEPKPEYQEEVSKNVQEALENVLSEGKVQIASTGISDSLISLDQDLALSLTRAKQSFAAACDSILKTKGETISVSVNPEIGQFADRAQTDYLIFARGTGYKSSGGAKATDIVLAGIFGGDIQWNGLVLEIGIVDASNAQVLWYNRNEESDSDYNPLESRSVEKLCRKLLKKLIKA